MNVEMQRPSTLRSGIFFWTLKYLALIIGVLFLVLGFGLVIAGPALIFGMDLFPTEALQDLEGSAQHELKIILRAYGIIALLIAPFFFVIKWLSEMILARNRYIDAVEVAIEAAKPKSGETDSAPDAKDTVNYK